jgi:RNA polymerase sigma-70 factor (ECF subfamily)
MNSDADLKTSASLLQRVGEAADDRDAWTQFIARYRPRILAWCRHWQPQESDAEDVAQEVLLGLVEKLRSFHYDASRSFRAWLKTLVHHAWQDFLDRRARPGRGSGESVAWQTLNSVAAREDLDRHLEELYDREVLEEAMSRVQRRVAPHTWEAFRLLTFERHSSAQVAPRVGLQVTMVYVAKSKVQKMLREEIDRIEAWEPA